MRKRFRYLVVRNFFFMLCRKITFLTLILLCCTVGTISAQYLVVKKPGKVESEKYFAGDEIQLKIKGADWWLKGNIQYIGDSSISVDSREIALLEIEAVRVPLNFTGTLGSLMMSAGIFFTSIITVNGIINNDSPIIGTNQLIIGSSLVATGWALRKFKFKYLPIGKKYIILVI